MKISMISAIPKDSIGSYQSIHDDGSNGQRMLFITDDEGVTVTLKNEQIGELYRRIKPPLAG